MLMEVWDVCIQSKSVLTECYVGLRLRVPMSGNSLYKRAIKCRVCEDSRGHFVIFDVGSAIAKSYRDATNMSMFQSLCNESI